MFGLCLIEASNLRNGFDFQCISNMQATGPSQDNLAVSGGLSSPWNDTRSLQVLTNEVTMLVPDKTIVTKQIPCEICKISCNSQNAYEKHIAGKKHNRNLRLLSNPTNNTLLAGPSNTNTKLEKVCTTCNVVCNSEDMYDKHIAGKKHVKKVNPKFNYYFVRLYAMM